MPMCNAYVQSLCAMPMCNAYMQRLCAMPMCNAYVQRLCAMPTVLAAPVRIFYLLIKKVKGAASTVCQL